MVTLEGSASGVEQLEPHLSREWFAAWLRGRFTVKELIEATHKTQTLASKFRTGKAFPKGRYLADLAAKHGDVELILAGIALLDEFAPLRHSIADSLADLAEASESRGFAARRVALDRQLDRRLDRAGDGQGIIHSSARFALIVEDGHGVSELARRLSLRLPPEKRVFDLSTSSDQDGQVVGGAGGALANPDAVLVVPRSRHAALEAFDGRQAAVASPTWDEMFESVFGEPPSHELGTLRDALLKGVPLRLVNDALLAYRRRLVQPSMMHVVRQEPVAPVARERRADPLTAAQRTLLEPAATLARPYWGVLVAEVEGLSSVVARHVAEMTGGTLLFGEDPDLQVILRAWVELLDKPRAWPAALPGSPVTADPVLVVDLDVNHPSVGETVIEALSTVIADVSDLRPATRWYLCGREEQVARVAATLTEQLPTVFVPAWPSQRPAETRSVGALAARSELLPDVCAWDPDAVRDAWLDHAGLETALGALLINAVVEVPIGQGATAAALVTMARRREIDGGNQAYVSIDDYVRSGQVRRILGAQGFATTRAEGSYAAELIGSPYLHTVRPVDEEERIAMAERASREILDHADVSLDDWSDRVLYLDLSASRYGRVPADTNDWNQTERLTHAYRMVAERLLHAVAGRTAQTFVFVPTGIYDRALFAPEDWQPVVVAPLHGEKLDEIVGRYGRHSSEPAPDEVRCAIATAEVAVLPKPPAGG